MPAQVDVLLPTDDLDAQSVDDRMAEKVIAWEPGAANLMSQCRLEDMIAMRESKGRVLGPRDLRQLINRSRRGQS